MDEELVKVTLHHERDTKNMRVYKSPTDMGAIPAVYISKEALPAPFPEKIHVTVTSAD